MSKLEIITADTVAPACFHYVLGKGLPPVGLGSGMTVGVIVTMPGGPGGTGRGWAGKLAPPGAGGSGRAVGGYMPMAANGAGAM